MVVVVVAALLSLSLKQLVLEKAIAFHLSETAAVWQTASEEISLRKAIGKGSLRPS